MISGKPFVVTGVGSRETPEYMRDLFTEFGKYANSVGWFIRSGHAQGADYAFEIGARTNCVVYLPWASFNKEKEILGIPRTNDLKQKVLDIVYKHEPYAEKLSVAIKRIKSRNVYQVLGENLDKPSKVVVCWTPGGEVVGGTGLAIKIATEHKIPIINMGARENNFGLERLIETIKDFIG